MITLSRLPITLSVTKSGSFRDFTKNPGLPDQSSVSVFN